MKPAKRFILITGALLAIILVVSLSFGESLRINETLTRNFNFTKWAAKSVYLTQFKNITWYEALLGRGFGLPGWNATVGKLSFDYSSTESSFVSFVYQLGIIPTILLLCFFIKGLIKNKKNHRCFLVILGILINACFTPAFAGFAFSYIAWPILLMAYNGISAVK